MGANIGQFSLYAAKLGRQVLAVEPFIDSAYRIHKAAFIENLQDRIILLLNAVSNRRGTAWLRPNPDNIGGQGLEDDNNQNSSKILLPLKYRVQTILLDDLINFLPRLRRANEILKVASAFFAQAELDRRFKS